jgi:hypothetical protein
MGIENPIIPGHINEYERSIIKKYSSLTNPRKEYAEGLTKLDYKHTFSTGEVFEATEGDEGMASFVLKKEGQVIFDFAELLPPGFLFVTPRRRKHIPFSAVTEKIYGHWATECTYEIVLVGDMRTPEEIFVLLHEIGHTHQTKDWKESVMDESYVADKPGHTAAKYNSEVERNAAAYVIRALRVVKEKTKVNLVEVFKDKKEFTEFIYMGLLGHKMFNKSNLLFQDTKSIIDKIKRAWSGLPREDGELLDSLYDKGRMRRAKKQDL